MQRAINKNYLLILLMVVYSFNFVDRMAFGILLQDIKSEFQLTDTQLGFLTGIAYAFFYAVMGIPIARWADRGDRVKIIAIMTALQSVAVALLGLAGGFLHLMLIRIALSVGEAGCVPPAHSLIADYFSRGERARAVARYKLGVPLVMTLGYFVAGWLNELYGWRATFVFLALPGPVLAVLAWSTLNEPRRLRTAVAIGGPPSPEKTPSPSAGPSFKEVCVTLWANAAFRHLLLAYSVWTFFGQGLVQWQPAFFMRSYGLQTGQIGFWFALVYGVGGGLGVYLGGELATRYASDNERRQLVACAGAFACFPIVNAYVYLAPNHYLAFAAMAIAALGIGATVGPIFAGIQTLVAPRMRAMAIAIVFLFANLIGLGGGPFVTGALSDALHPWFGDESLRYSLLLLCPGYFWAAWHLWRASRTVVRDLAAVQVEDPSGTEQTKKRTVAIMPKNSERAATTLSRM